MGKKMFRINVSGDEKKYIKKKADELDLTVGAYAKLVLKSIENDDVPIEKDNRPPTVRGKPEAIMVELTKSQNMELTVKALNAEVYKSEWFRYVLTHVCLDVKAELC
jgi:hypothetical protein